MTQGLVVWLHWGNRQRQRAEHYSPDYNHSF